MTKFYVMGEAIVFYLDAFGIGAFLLSAFSAYYYLSLGVLALRGVAIVFATGLACLIAPSVLLVNVTANAFSSTSHMAYLGITITCGIYGLHLCRAVRFRQKSQNHSS